MLSRPQQILLKRAQREAALDDGDYRDALETVSGCRTSKAPELTDRHLDKVLAYVEAIFWRKVDRNELRPSCSANAVFRQRGYWAVKNTRQQTSRDRYTASNKSQEIVAIEAALAQLGFGPGYVAAIRQNVTHGRTDDRAQHLYLAALQRTLRAKQKHLVSPG